jgi:hypothetical protein
MAAPPENRIFFTKASDEAAATVWRGKVIHDLKALNSKHELLQCISSPNAVDVAKRMIDGSPAAIGNYSDMFSMLTTDGLARGQSFQGQAENGESVRWDIPGQAFIHHVYFPAITYNMRVKQWLGAGFALFYASEAPSNVALGHYSDFVPIKIDPLGIDVFVDFALIGRNLHSVAAIVTACATTRPVHNSYIFVVDCNREGNGDNRDPVEIKGASLGLACAMAVLHAPAVAYTGFLKKFPGAAKFTGDIQPSTDTIGYIGSTAGPPAANTDDVIEEVAGVQIKMAWAMQHNIPLVIPHKTSFGTSIMSKANLLPTGVLSRGYAQLAYSTTQADMGIAYSAYKSPLLLATTVPEAVTLGAYAYLAYVVKPVAQAPVVSYGVNKDFVDGTLDTYEKKQLDAFGRQQKNLAKYKRNPVKYVDETNKARLDKMNAVTQKQQAERDAKVTESKKRLDARRVKAVTKARGSSKESKNALRNNLSKLTGRSIRPKTPFGKKKKAGAAAPPDDEEEEAVAVPAPAPIVPALRLPPATEPSQSMQPSREEEEARNEPVSARKRTAQMERSAKVKPREVREETPEDRQRAYRAKQAVEMIEEDYNQLPPMLAAQKQALMDSMNYVTDSILGYGKGDFSISGLSMKLRKSPQAQLAKETFIESRGTLDEFLNLLQGGSID